FGSPSRYTSNVVKKRRSPQTAMPLCPPLGSGLRHAMFRPSATLHSITAFPPRAVQSPFGPAACGQFASSAPQQPAAATIIVGLITSLRSSIDAMHDPSASNSLPENAYTPLAPGEVYAPIIPAKQAPPELTPRSIGWGVFLCLLFTIASAYSGLKVGQVMEAAIPISILAIGLARTYSRRSSLLENVIIRASAASPRRWSQARS